MSVLTGKRESINREFRTQPYRSFNEYQKTIDTDRTLENVLDPGVSGRMFSNKASRISMEEWRHPSNQNFMDGGKIMASTVTANELNVTSLDAITATIGNLEAGTVSDDAGTAANRKIVLDLDNKHLKVFDDAGTPVLRVHLGQIT